MTTPVPSGVAAPAAFPPGGRRLVIFVLWDRRGAVDDYVLYALKNLGSRGEHVLVVVNGGLTDAARERLAGVSSDILVRDNAGFDIWAHKAALDHIGHGIADFDEVVLTNDTWFGPVGSFHDVYDRMDPRRVHFWGMTDHAREEPNPFTGKGVLEYHLQSFWIAVRREMFLSPEWRDYWRDLPEMPSYFDAVLQHETIFTAHFVARGFAPDVAFGVADFPTDHPALFAADVLLEAGCPLFKRRPFFHYPPFLDRHAVSGRRIAGVAERLGYPVDFMWQNLARNVEPKILNADGGMLEVLPEVDLGFDRGLPLRVVAIVHIFYVDMTDELLDRLDRLPVGYDLVVTTPDATRATEIEAVIRRRDRARGSVDIRVVASNDGRDQSAFLIGCRDVLLDGGYDLVIKLHSKRTPQDGFVIGRHFKEQQLGNLLAGEGYAANLLALFQREPGLGIVYPPMIHVGYPTMGRAWWSNKARAAEVCKELSIRVPLDDVSPLAPLGSMFVARPEALALLVGHAWEYSDFGGPHAYQDGSLAHVLERLPSYAAGELGFHTRTVATAEYMAISHTSLEYKLDQMSASAPGDALEQIQTMRSLGGLGGTRAIDLLRFYLRARSPGVARLLVRVFGRDAVLGRAARWAKGRLR